MLKLFTPPKFTDSECTRKSQLLFTIICGSASIATITLIVNCFLLPQHIERWLITIIVFDMVSLGALFLNLHGFIRSASIVFVAMFFTVLFGLAWFGGGGINATAIRFLPFVVLITGLLMGKNGGYAIGVFAILVGLVFFLAGNLGFLPRNIIIVKPLDIWVIFTMCISLFVFFQSISVKGLNKALSEAKQELEGRIKSESRLKSIGKNFTAGMIYQLVIEPDGTRKFTYLSDSVKQLYGISPEEGLADVSLIYGRIYGDDKVVLTKAENEALKTMSPLKVEIRIKNPSGELRWSSLVSTPTKIENGLTRWEGIEVIITERKKNEQLLRESEEFRKRVFESSRVPIAILDAQTLRYVDCNAAAVHIYHFNTREEVLERGIGDFSAKMQYDGSLSSEKARIYIDKAIAEGSVTFEWRHQRPDGEMWDAEVYLMSFRSDERIFLQFTLQDITERKRMEMALRISETKYRTLFEAANDAIFLMEKHVFVECNQKALRMFGVSREQIIGKSPDWFSPPQQHDGRDSREEVAEKVSRALGGESQIFEWLLCRGDDSLFYVEVSLTRIAYLDRVQLLAIVHDITERKEAEEKQRKSDALYFTLFKNAPVGIFYSTVGGKIIRVNNEYAKMMGYASPEEVKEIVNRSSIMEVIYVEPDERSEFMERITAIPGNWIKTEKKFRKKDGTIMMANVVIRVLPDNPEQLEGFLEDITERKNAEMALQESEDWYRTIIHTMLDGFWLTDLQGQILAVNESYCRMSGYSEQELLGMHINNIDSVEMKNDTENRIRKIVEQGTAHFESRHRRKDGTQFYVDIIVKYQPVKGGRFASFFRDITQRKQYEENLKSALRDKDALLQELYHRTKNNMMVISTLLELQAATTDNEDTKRIVKDSVFRIRTMALAHEKLYKTQNLSRINMKEYISELAHLLVTGFGISQKKIAIQLDVEEVSLLIDIAIPCGLIINELLSNCFKYAFPEERKGRIDLSLHRKNHNELELLIKDNGIGIAQSVDITKTPTLGVPLVIRIVKNQLHGSSSVENENGIKWRIRFRDDLYSERV